MAAALMASGLARELVTAVRAARGVHQAGAVQLLQQLADRGRRDMGAFRQACRR